MFRFFKKFRPAKTCEERLIDIEIKLLEKIEVVTQRLNDIPLIYAVNCTICGCMVRKVDAVRGKSTIKLRGIRGIWHGPIPQEEYIYTPLYCKRCAPKKAK